jgi:hypothetical protein
MCQNFSVAKKGNFRKLGVEAQNYVLWRVQFCAYGLWYQWVQWIILRNMINLNIVDYGIYLRNISFFPLCVCMCVLAKDNIVIWRGLLHSFKNVTYFKHLRERVTYGNCVDEQIKIRLNLGQVSHSVQKFPICSLKT